jgi:hypothetical protein
MSTESFSNPLHDGVSLLSLTLFMGIGYGTVFTIYVQCLFSLARGPMRQAPRLFFLSYTSFMFILETLYAAANSRRVWIAFITNWGSPTGPASAEIGLWHDWASVAAMACYIISNWLADLLMVGSCYHCHDGALTHASSQLWRCIILFQNMKNTRWLIPVPCCMFFAVIGTCSMKC